jgi:FkbM family methyltransferase
MNWYYRISIRIIGKRFNCTLPIRREGKKFRIPIIYGVGFPNLLNREPMLIEILKGIHFGHSDCFIDVGVNVGQTLLALKCVNSKVKYFGFEPNVTCCSYVEELCAKNNFGCVDVFPVAISSKNGITELESSPGNRADSGSSIIKGFRKGPLKKSYIGTVGGQTIQDLLGAYQVKIIKIDVEGAELEVLRSLEEIIAKFRPSILCEVLPVYNESNEFRLGRQREIEMLLKRWSYKIMRITDSGLMQLDEFGIHSNLSDSNYLFRPVN